MFLNMGGSILGARTKQNSVASTNTGKGQACASKHKSVCQSRITASTREKIRTFLNWQLKTQHHKFLGLLRSNLETFVSSGYSCQTKKSDPKKPPRVLRGLDKIHAKNRERRGVVWKAHHLGLHRCLHEQVLYTAP